MSTDVKIKLQVEGSDANAKIRGVKDGVAAVGESARVATGRMGALKTAIGDAFRSSARGTLNDIRGIAGAASGLAGTLAAIGGGAGLGELVTDSIRARDQMTRLRIESGQTGSQMEATMARARRAAEQFGTPVGQITAGLQVWQDRFAHLDVGTGAMEQLAEFARASGEEITNIVGVAGELNRQLGIGPERMGDMLALMRAQGQQGSVTFGDIARHAPDLLAKEGSTFGVRGEAGLRESGAMFQRIATRQPDAAQAATQQRALLRDMAEGRTQERLRSHGVAFRDAAGHLLAPLQIVQNVLARTGGDMTKIGEIFHNSESKDAFLAFVEDFRQGGGDIRASNTALSALMNVQVAAGQTSRDAATAMQTFEARLQAVRARLANIVDDRLMARVGRLVDLLPQGVEQLVRLVDYIAENPAGAAGHVAAGRLALGVGGSLAGQGVAAMGRAMASSFSTGAAGPIGGAVRSAIAGAGAQHVVVDNWPSGGLPGGGPGSGGPGGAEGSPGGGRAGRIVGGALNLAAAGGLGWELGSLVDDLYTQPMEAETASANRRSVTDADDVFVGVMNRQRQDREYREQQERQANERATKGRLLSPSETATDPATVAAFHTWSERDARRRADLARGVKRTTGDDALDERFRQDRDYRLPSAAPKSVDPRRRVAGVQSSQAGSAAEVAIKTALQPPVQVTVNVTDSTRAGVAARVQNNRQPRAARTPPRR